MTLPTRADGGIDWDKLWPPETVRPEALRLSFIQVWKEAAAHTRERCAKIALAHKGSTERERVKHGFKLSEEIREEARGEDIAAEMITAAIRRMGD